MLSVLILKILVCFFVEIGQQAAVNALNDANIDYKDVEAVVVSHVYGESTSGNTSYFWHILYISYKQVYKWWVNKNCRVMHVMCSEIYSVMTIAACIW